MRDGQSREEAYNSSDDDNDEPGIRTGQCATQ